MRIIRQTRPDIRTGCEKRAALGMERGINGIIASLNSLWRTEIDSCFFREKLDTRKSLVTGGKWITFYFLPAHGQAIKDSERAHSKYDNMINILQSQIEGEKLLTFKGVVPSRDGSLV